MAAPQILGRLSRGMDRTRVRGDADVSSLYNLFNAYVTTAGRVKKRPPMAAITRDGVDALDPNTRGLFSAGGKLHTFYSVESVVVMPGVEHHRLVAPATDDDEPLLLVAVHFAAMYLGGLYVVAEFEGAAIYHYWLQSQSSWEPNTIYFNGQLVKPTTLETGYYYEPTTSDSPPAWKPSTKYSVGDAVQPTTYNGFKYVVREADGDSPSSGAAEPSWIATEGALVYEDTDSTPTPPSSPSAGNGGTPGGDRYNNLPGYRQRQIGALPS